MHIKLEVDGKVLYESGDQTPAQPTPVTPSHDAEKYRSYAGLTVFQLETVINRTLTTQEIVDAVSVGVIDDGQRATPSDSSGAAAANQREQETQDFDPARPNSPRVFQGHAGSSMSRTYVAPRDGTLEVSCGGDAAGAASTDVAVGSSTASANNGMFNVHAPVLAGQTYIITVGSAYDFRSTVRAGMM